MMSIYQWVRVAIAATSLSITALFLPWGGEWASADEQAEPPLPSIASQEAYIYTAHLFNLSGREIARLQEGRFYRFSPNSQRLITRESLNRSASTIPSIINDNSTSAQFRLFNLSGEKLLEQQGSVATFSLDGQRLLIADGETTYLFNASGEKLAQLPGKPLLQLPTSSPDGRQLVTSTDRSSYPFDASGQLIAQLPGYVPRFSLDGQQIITHGHNVNYLFDATGRQIAQMQGENIVFSPNGRQIITDSNYFQSYFTYLYDLSGNLLTQLQGMLPSISPDGNWILTMFNDPSTLFDSSGRKIATLAGSFGTFSPDSQHFFTNSNDTIRLFNLQGEELAQMPGELAVFSADSQQIITYESDCTTHSYNLSGRELARWSGSAPLNLNLQRATSADQNINRTLFYLSSPDRQRIITTNQSCIRFDSREEPAEINLFDFQGRELARLPGLFYDFSLSGQYFVTEFGGQTHLFDRQGNQLAEFQGSYEAFSPDSQMLVISTSHE